MLLDEDQISALLLDGLQGGQTVTCRVKSSSMVPTFQIGDLLEIEGTMPFVGDVAVYWKGKDWVTHRVVELQPGGILTRGDADKLGDGEFIESKRIIGRVVRWERDTRGVIVFLVRRLVALLPSRMSKIVPQPCRQWLATKLMVDKTRIRFR